MSAMADTAHRIHPTAIVGKECELAADVEVGPYCVVSGKVSLGQGVRLIAHVHVNGPAVIGAGTTIYPFASLGLGPQDLKYKPGQPTGGIKVGQNCQVREHVTIHAATKPDIPTSTGDRAFLMVGSHLGHDVQIGNDVTLVNGTMLGGHAQVGDNATLAGGTAVHQFTRIGRFAFVSGVPVAMDIPPFCLSADRNQIHGINQVGLRRSGMPREHITLIRKAFREVFRPTLPRAEMIARLEELGATCPPVLEMARFVQDAKRSIAGGTARPPRAMITWMHYARRGTTLEGLESDEE